MAQCPKCNKTIDHLPCRYCGFSKGQFSETVRKGDVPDEP